jgi:hypothetical protein
MRFLKQEELLFATSLLLRAQIHPQPTAVLVGQLFNIPDSDGDQLLDKIFIVARVELSQNKPMVFDLRLVDLGDSPSMDEYNEGTNLLGTIPRVEIASPSPDSLSGQIVKLHIHWDEPRPPEERPLVCLRTRLCPENKGILTWYRGVGLRKLPDCPVFRVFFSEETNASSPRTAIKDSADLHRRQNFPGKLRIGRQVCSA